MKRIKLFAAAAALMMAMPGANAQVLTYLDPELPREQRIEDLLSRLTLEEKVGMMMNSSKPVERLGIPAYDWWNEALHGVARAGLATVYPQAIGMAATFDPEGLQEAFTLISDEARAKYNGSVSKDIRQKYYGLTFWTPNINIFRDPRWGRGQETYGEDPFLTSRMGVAVVRGLQGDNPDYYKTHACAKHFAVHSGPEWNRHKFDVTVSERDLWETYLPAFKALATEAGVREFMGAYNRYDGSPCCGSELLLKDILRGRWAFDGLVVSDCGAINDFYVTGAHEVCPDAASSSARAGLTGTETVLDLYCGAGTITQVMARRAGRVIGAEIVPAAIADARENARRNGIGNVEFFCGDASAVAADFAARGLRPDVICVDPPRKGLSPDVVSAAARMQPQRIVYVSCDPATLARDVKLFAQEGYGAVRAAAVDMFPGTANIESVVRLERTK